jgi:prepilin-type N-terminal cleavage/methylation domain-containing protein
MKRGGVGTVGGFTLVELLVVVAIILALASMIMAVIAAFNRDRKRQEASATLQNLALAIRTLKERYDYDGVWGKDEKGEPLKFSYKDSGNAVKTYDLKDWPWEEFTHVLAPNHPAWEDDFSKTSNPPRLPHLNWNIEDKFDFIDRQLNGRRVVDPWGVTYRYHVFTDFVDDGVKGVNYEAEVIYSLGADGEGDVLGPVGLEAPDPTGDTDERRADDVVILIKKYPVRQKDDGEPGDSPWKPLHKKWVER